MILNMGSLHPLIYSFQLIVNLDGEDVIDCEPILGHLHTKMEIFLEE